MAESGAAAARAAALRRAQAAERARERARRRRQRQRQARLEREARARAAREQERVRQVVQPSRQADQRLTLPRAQQEGLAGTRSRRNQSRRERREQQRLERVAKRLAAQVARQTAEPRRSSRRGADEAASIARQMGPMSGPDIVPRAARALGQEARAQRAQARAETRPDLSSAERAALPGSSLRGDAFRDYQMRAAEAEATNQAGLGGALEGLANIFTLGIPSAFRSAIEDPSLASIGGAAASVFPFGFAARGARLGTIAARAAAQGEDVGEIVGAAARQTGRGTRFVRLNDSSIQFYSSPSRITRTGQQLLDAASEYLAARGRGGPLSATSRVPKQAGKRIQKEQVRRVAKRKGEIDLIRKIGGGSTRAGRPLERPERTGFFYEAQMPDSLRGGEGLRLIRDDLQDELAKLTPEEIARNPQRPVNLRNEITKLEKAVASSRKYDERALDAARVLMNDRLDILVRAGRISPETAAERTTLLSRRLLGEGDDFVEGQGRLFGRANEGEIYVGHREGPVRGGRRMGPGGMSTTGTIGKTRAPQGVGQQNTLSLYSQGRLRTDPDVIVEDWQAAQAYEFNNLAKDELARMGEPIDPLVGLKEGYILVNPQGHMIPRTLRRQDNLEGEGFTDTDMVSDLAQYIDNYLPVKRNTLSGGRVEIVPDVAAVRAQLTEMAAGNPLYQNVRQVRADVAERFFNNLIDPRIVKTHPFLKVPSRAGKTLDAANDILYLSLIYSNPGYVPANLAGNLAFNLLHEGIFAPVNLTRAGQLLAHGPKDLRTRILAEVGHGPTTSIASSFLKKPAMAVGRLADDGPRVAAFLHEAAKAKVISKAKPKLSQADYDKLRGLFNEQNRPLLNDISQRAEEAMVRFDRLSPFERSIAKRFLFVWPWIRGATAYPFRYAADYPLRAGALGAGSYAASQSDEVQDRLMEGMPPWLRGAVQVGEQTINGQTFPTVLNTGPISPVSTAYETISSALGRPGFETVGEFLNPGLMAALDVAQKKSPWGREIEGGAEAYGQAAAQALERLAPQFGLARDLISPPEEGGLYPGDVTRLGRLARASRVVPYPIDPREARELAQTYGTVPDYPRDPARAARGRGQGVRRDRLTGEASERRVELSGYRTMPLRNADEKIDEVFASLPEASRDRAKESLRVKYRIDAAIDESVAGKNGRYDYEKATALMVDLIGEYRPDIAHYAEDAFDRISDVDQAKAFWDKGLELIREYYPWNEVAKGFAAWDKQHSEQPGE